MAGNIAMTSNQPYMLKAFYDWIVDNELTPYIVVNATMEGVQVPQQFVKDGQIVLNVSPSACVHFEITYEYIAFQARFGGQPQRVYMPSAAVLAIYARENGAGTVFATESELIGNSPKSKSSEPVKKADKSEESQPANKKTKPSLRVVK